MKSQATHRFTKVVIVLACGFVLGTLGSIGVLAFLTSSTNEIQDNVSEFPHQIEPLDVHETQNSATNLSVLLTQEYTTEFEWDVALRVLLLKSGRDTLLEYLSQSKELDFASPSRRTDAQCEILARLLELDPGLAMEQIDKFATDRREALVVAAFHRWSVIDFHGALAGALTVDVPFRRSALEAILNASSELSDREKHRVEKQIESTGLAGIWIGGREIEEYLDDPQISWFAVQEDSINDELQRDQLRTIANVWFERDGPEILSILGRTDIGREIADAILNEVVALDPRYAFELASTTDRKAFLDNGQVRKELQLLALRRWVQLDPQEALNAIEADGSGVSDFERESLLRSTVRSWARDDPDGILNAMHLLPAKVQPLAREYAIIGSAASDLDETVRLLKDDSLSRSTRKKIANQMLRKWSVEDPYTLLDWLETERNLLNVLDDYLWIHNEGEWLKTPKGPEQGLRFALQNLARSDPHRALEYAARHDALRAISQGNHSLEVAVFNTVSMEDIDSALELLPHLSDNRRLDSHRKLAVRLIETGNEPDRVLDLGKQLPKHEREEYYKNTIQSWALMRPKQLFKSIELLPDQQLQSFAARFLIETSTSFDRNERKTLDKFVSKGES